MANIFKRIVAIPFVCFMFLFAMTACSSPMGTPQTNNQDASNESNSFETVSDLKLADKPEQLHLAVMCDVHVPYGATDEDHMVINEDGEKEYKNNNDGTQAQVYASALEEVIEDGYSTLLVVGDLTGKSKQSEYDLYNETIKAYAGSLNIIESMGNHEMRSVDDEERAELAKRWSENMGTPLYFDERIEGAHVWALGSDVNGDNWGKASISKEQLDWLEAGLDQDYEDGVTSIIMCHWPVDGTYPANSASDKRSLSEGEGSFNDKAISARLKELVVSHPNAVLFSGHTHSSVVRKGQMAICQPEPGGGIFVHAGAIKSASPKWATIDEVSDIPDNSGTVSKKYEIRYRNAADDLDLVYSWTWSKPGK